MYRLMASALTTKQAITASNYKSIVNIHRLKNGFKSYTK